MLTKQFRNLERQAESIELSSQMQKLKSEYEVDSILDAFREVKKHYGDNFRYRTQTYWNGYHSIMAECFINDERKEFWFCSPSSEPSLKNDEYWLVYYYKLSSNPTIKNQNTSSTPMRGKKSDLKENLISVLENYRNSLFF